MHDTPDPVGRDLINRSIDLLGRRFEPCFAKQFPGRLHSIAKAAFSSSQFASTTASYPVSPKQIEQQFRRAAFNVIARNQDDHVKNIAFLMNREGEWSLAPAHDVVYSYNPTGAWTSQHQMSINGKRDNFELPDLVALANAGGIKKRKAEGITSEVSEAVGTWHKHADAAGVFKEDAEKIPKVFRMGLIK